MCTCLWVNVHDCLTVSMVTLEPVNEKRKSVCHLSSVTETEGQYLQWRDGKIHVPYIRSLTHSLDFSLLFLKCLDVIFHLPLFETDDCYFLLLWIKTDFCTEKYFMYRCSVLQFKVAVAEIACFSLLWGPSAFSLVCRKGNATLLGWGWWLTRLVEDTGPLHHLLNLHGLAECPISVEPFVIWVPSLKRDASHI